MYHNATANSDADAPVVERGTTTDFAKQYLVKPDSVRTRYCLTGSYFGVIPEKLPNGRLLWPLTQEVAA
jgi:hypothetical protein